MHNEAITFDDVLLVPSYNHHESRRVVDIGMTDRCSKLSLKLPVMSSNMDTITESKMANFMHAKGGIGVLHRFLSIEGNVKEFKNCEGKVFVSVGCSEQELQRAEALRDAGAEYFCVDVAHAHAKYVGKTLKSLRKLLADRCIMAGNVATYAGADYLASCGADIIKAGIGGGSVCSTRIKTGFGIPMLTCIQDCARSDRSIVADGGIRTSGDIVKALAFGADFVMIGGMLAGTGPTPGKIVEKEDGSKVKFYRGMASREAQEEFLGQMHEWKTAEGVATEVPYRDVQDQIIADIIGGLRSGLTYAGADTISELQRKLNYVVVTPAGRTESLPHKLLG
ncbi:guanosine monophosphate reductase [Legionella israelensis]|uniref:GMP reductase n=1 Tax=Legionella israelensis TaxID=454 RepID=A0A0W0WQK5_9GAMM|nr:guanosine monophosphate reductase [Legionella israelensis]KTD34588.1 inosine 5'-monophosphate dehydrogenase [Legionella israelensis]QBR83117.1 guanosine monophosphate reductase [Legionella israelensis]QBS09507.1 guanosine monophosphate reductase [Legionella israelensis]SCY00019.1 IMP dehydrogenase [Legionella israelensis DSM 19235]STX60422.1 GMP reductase [Legionella israelensis]